MLSSGEEQECLVLGTWALEWGAGPGSLQWGPLGSPLGFLSAGRHVPGLRGGTGLCRSDEAVGCPCCHWAPGTSGAQELGEGCAEARRGEHGLPWLHLTAALLTPCSPFWKASYRPPPQTRPAAPASPGTC